MITTLPPLSPVPLLRTKLFPADAGAPTLLPRSALIERLMAARAQRLVVLSAPAGFGKSTVLSLLRQHLMRQGARVAWLSCDESDSEPARLMQYLSAAIEAVAPTFTSTPAGLVPGDVSWPVEALIDAFVADLKRLDGDIYLMLDDFHRIRHLALGQAVRYLLKSLPDNVRLVVSTRYKPRFIS
ncbi:MAG: AAA family ATPase, partial [Pseudomonadales bacterium]|nr:AAA family ATPase [Pseudomonadales bacterium]